MRRRQTVTYWSVVAIIAIGAGCINGHFAYRHQQAVKRQDEQLRTLAHKQAELEREIDQDIEKIRMLDDWVSALIK